MKRWPVIRHVRWFWLAILFEIWWRRVGHRHGLVPSQSDLAYLDRVWRGEL